MSEDRRETWLAWLPPGSPEPPLITRGELLATLARRGLAVTAQQLRSWETAGALPAAIRRRRHGATHAVYPAWHAEVVGAVPRLLADRQPLAQLRPALRALFEQEVQQAGRGERPLRYTLPAPVPDSNEGREG